MTNLDNLEGTRTPEELAENFRELNRIAPTPAEKFRLMFGQSNESMNELPANLPPLPPVPEGFDRWEYRGEAWKTDQFARYAYLDKGDSRWGLHSREYVPHGSTGTHYLEAVRDEPATLKEAVDQWHAAKDQSASRDKPPCDCIEKCGRYWTQSCYCLNEGSQEEAQAWCEEQNDKPPATGTEAGACEGETPLTDQQAIRPETAAIAGAAEVVTAEFACDLERKLAEARRALEGIARKASLLRGYIVEEVASDAKQAIARIDASTNHES